MRKILWASIIALVAAAGYAGFKHWQKPPAPVAAVHETETAPAETRRQVELTPEKLARADLHASIVEPRALQHSHTVPGKIEYNALKYVELKASVESTIRQVLVKPGAAVTAGTRLAILDSPDIGLVRAEVEKNRAELRLAAQAYDWSEQLAKNTLELLDVLKSRPSPRDVEKQFDNKPLGDQRQKLLASYSRAFLADDLAQSAQPLVQSGSISMHTVKQREVDREVARAEFHAAKEQSRFEMGQQREKSRAARDYAQQVFEVSRQRLRTLLGTSSEIEEASSTTTPETAALTRFYLIAPIAGSVESRTAASGQRIPAGQPLFTIADTQTLWVTAELREQDWPASKLPERATLSIRVPALEGKVFTASVDFVGRSVSPETQSLPLIAAVPNTDGLLKPGMFAWIELPIGTPQTSLAIPQTAVVKHENRSFVFVEEGPRRFLRKDIVTGIDTAEWIAVTHGLNPGDKVVDRGTFLLKSELLLEPED